MNKAFQRVSSVSLSIFACIVSSISVATVRSDDVGDTLKTHPKLNTLPPVRASGFLCSPYLRMANSLQRLGEKKAMRMLLRACDTEDDSKTAVLCRMLFQAKDGAAFRGPFLGAPGYLGRTASADWPLQPIELVDGVPFCIVSGYGLGGRPEPASQYIQYCIRNCSWSNYRFRPRTKRELEKSLQVLLHSNHWKQPLDKTESDWLESQIQDSPPSGSKP